MEVETRKSSNSLHFGHGTHFGKRGIVRIKLSNKDLVLIVGIAVAVIIAITKMLDSKLPQKESKEQAKPNVSLPSASVLIDKIGAGVIQELVR